MIKGKNTYAVYIGLCVALLPVLLLRDFTPDNELRYLSIADEALRNNTFFTFTNHGVPYADKPPLYLWFVMLGKWLFGSHQMWFLSLFSLVPALVTMHVMDRWTGRSLNSEGHATARLMLLTCALFVGMAVTLRMDMLMCMFIVLALRSFFRLYSAQPENARTAACGVAGGMAGAAVSAEAAAREKWLFPIYVFMAVFSKGPIGILVPLLAPTVFLIYKRRLRQFGRYWGWRTWAILIVLCAGWFGAVYAEGGNEYLDNLLFHQTLDRAVNAFHHERPFYFYAISVWYSIAPWSLAVIGLIVAAACKKLITTDLQQFFVTIMLTTFVMLSCISSKVHIYLLPAFPFMVYTGMMFMPAFSRTKWLKLTIAIPSAAIAASLPALAVIANGKDTSWLGLPAFYAAAAILSASGIYAIISLYGKRGGADKAVRTIAVGMLAAVFAGGWALPQVKEQIGYGALCEKALEVSQATGTTDFCTWNIKRSENMDVYLHRDVEIIPKEETPKAEAGRTKVLMTRTRDASTFKGCKTYTVGKYAVIVLK